MGDMRGYFHRLGYWGFIIRLILLRFSFVFYTNLPIRKSNRMVLNFRFWSLFINYQTNFIYLYINYQTNLIYLCISTIKPILFTSVYQLSNQCYLPLYINYQTNFIYLCTILGVSVVVFNATFSIFSAISWWWVLLVKETRVPGENQQPVASL